MVKAKSRMGKSPPAVEPSNAAVVLFWPLMAWSSPTLHLKRTGVLAPAEHSESALMLRCGDHFQKVFVDAQIFSELRVKRRAQQIVLPDHNPFALEVGKNVRAAPHRFDPGRADKNAGKWFAFHAFDLECFLRVFALTDAGVPFYFDV